MKIGKIAGIRFRVNIIFLLLCIVYAYLGLIINVLIVFSAVLIHELAHALAAAMLGIKVTEVEIMPFGGQAKIEDFTGLETDKEIYLAVIGPLVSLVLAGFLYFLPAARDRPHAQVFMHINLLLGLFNCLPALPLDGGRILRAALSSLIGYRKATESTARLGKIIALGITGYGLYVTYINYSGANYIITGILLFWAARRESQYFGYAFMRFLINKKKELAQSGLLPCQQVVAKPDTPVKDILNGTRPAVYIITVIVNDYHQVMGFKSEAELIDCLFEKGPKAVVSDCQ